MHLLLIGATGRTGTAVLSESLRRGHSITALVRDPSAFSASEALTSLLATNPLYKDQLTLIKGSPLNQFDVLKAVKSAAAAATNNATTTAQDNKNNNNDNRLVVITTLNARRTSDSPLSPPHPSDSPPRMMADSTANLITALSSLTPTTTTTTTTTTTPNKPTTRPPKIISLSALGAGSSAQHAHWLIRAMVARTNMKYQFEDHAAVEEELRAAAVATGAQQPIDFVIVRPTRLEEARGGDDDNQTAKVFDTTAPAKSSGICGGGTTVPTVGMMAAISRVAVAKFLVDAAESDRWDGQAPILV